MKFLGIIILAIMLGACHTASYYEGNENSPFYLVPAGSTLTLTRPLTVPADQVAVFLQGGEIVTSGRINQYYPHCKFELRHRRDAAQNVQADSFAITKVVQEVGHSVALDDLRLARTSVGVGIGINVGGGWDDGGSLQAFSTRLRLQSANQPEVFRLSCGQAALLHEGQHVSIKEMRQALGEIFSLQLLPPKRP